MLVILTFQSKQHAPFAVGPRPAPGVTLLTPGSWPLFRTLQRLTLRVTVVIEKLLRRVLPRGPSVDHLVEGAGPPHWSPNRGGSVCVCSPECECIDGCNLQALNTTGLICVSLYHAEEHLKLAKKTWKIVV